MRLTDFRQPTYGWFQDEFFSETRTQRWLVCSPVARVGWTSIEGLTLAGDLTSAFETRDRSRRRQPLAAGSGRASGNSWHHELAANAMSLFSTHTHSGSAWRGTNALGCGP